MSNKNTDIAKEASNFITIEEMEKKKLHNVNEVKNICFNLNFNIYIYIY